MGLLYRFLGAGRYRSISARAEKASGIVCISNLFLTPTETDRMSIVHVTQVIDSSVCLVSDHVCGERTLRNQCLE